MREEGLIFVIMQEIMAPFFLHMRTTASRKPLFGAEQTAADEKVLAFGDCWADGLDTCGKTRETINFVPKGFILFGDNISCVIWLLFHQGNIISFDTTNSVAAAHPIRAKKCRGIRNI